MLRARVGSSSIGKERPTDRLQVMDLVLSNMTSYLLRLADVYEDFVSLASLGLYAEACRTCTPVGVRQQVVCLL